MLSLDVYFTFVQSSELHRNFITLKTPPGLIAPDVGFELGMEEQVEDELLDLLVLVLRLQHPLAHHPLRPAQRPLEALLG